MKSVTLFDLAKVRDELERTNREIEQPDFWEKLEYAQKVMKEKKSMEQTVENYEKLEKALDDMEEMIEITEMEEEAGADAESLTETAESIEADFESVQEELEELRLKTLLTGKYDHCGAILSIHAGTGGVDAMDWASMLLRMYTRWCDKKGYTVKMLDLQDDTEAGIKSATLLVEGENAYGYLKNEKGVHRLVRISPLPRRVKRRESGRPLLRCSKSRRKSTMKLQLRLTRKICELIPIEAAVRADSMSTRRIRRFVSRTCRRTSL